MMHEYKLQPEKMEKIEATRHCNKWAPDFAIRIAETKDKTEEEDGQDRAEIKIYTDGSGCGGKIGASESYIEGVKRKDS